ncbi:sensor histidine kinase [Deinococcus sp.]|uniref:sensor histidine kinase n=1 Tax=Deinococcus sp. TaxID=47478 RepID=UPI003C7CA4B0
MNAPEDHLSSRTKRNGRPGRSNTLRFQFTLVIFLLAFMPNAVLTLGAGHDLGLVGGAALPLGLWLALVALLSAAIGWVLSGALLRPLSRLTGELARGEFQPAQHEPVQYQSQGRLSDDPQEIQALRGAFSGLLERLGTEQGRRSAFMATLVHDLKTPLVATGHLIRTLSNRPLPDLERHALGEHLLTENARLLGLVQQMADAHRFEREDVRLTPADTDLRALLERVAARLRQGRVVPGVRVLVTGEGEAAVDAAVLERAVANLADNALRYASSRLELWVGPRGISVCDDGPGLPDGASIETLAQPFNAQPVEIAGQHYTAGTAGLGLYIVRRIAEAHGGHLLYRREPRPGLPALSVMQIHLPQVFGVAETASESPKPADSAPVTPPDALSSDASTASLRSAPMSLSSQEVYP